MMEPNYPKSILLIEDAEPDIILFRRAIKALGYNIKIKEVRDGISALNELKNNNNEYDLVILDINLPQISGFEVIQKLKNEGIELPEIVVLTSSDLDEDKENAKKLGLTKYYIKPMNFAKFKDLVKEMLEKEMN